MAGRAPTSPLEAAALELGVPVLHADGDLGPVAAAVAKLRPHLIAIALFPRRLPAEMLALAPRGALNAHPSLLPRHRGPLPLFWTYHADDRETGVTIHHASDRLDAGDVVAREAFELPRGFPGTRLDAVMAERVGPLLAEAVVQVASGNAARVPQDEAAATPAPFIRAGVPMVDFERWPAERVWHFLSALAPHYREPLKQGDGRPVDYGRVTGWSPGAPRLPPGGVESSAGGWTLCCRDGTVALAPAEAR